MKHLLITFLTLISLMSFSQDTLRLDSLKVKQMNEVQVVGIRSPQFEPVTSNTFKMDSTLKTYQGQDPFFILNTNTPGVFTQSDNGLPYGYSYMRIRGIDQTRINFTLNGIPLNEMEDQGIYFSNMPDFLNNVSEVQVQRGVGTSKYGTTSVGGSVNFETEAPITPKASLIGGVGSFGSERLSLKYSTGYIRDTKFAGSLNFNKLNTEGFRRNSGSRGQTIFGQFGYYGDKNTVKIYGFSGMSDNQMSWLPVPIDVINKDYRTNLNSKDEKDKFDQNFVALTWVNYSRSNLKFNSSIYGNNIKGSYTSYLDATTLGKFSLNSYQTGAMSNMVYTFRGFTVNSGLNYNWYQRQHRLSDNSLPDVFWYTNYGNKQDFIAFSKLNYNCNKWNFFTDLQYRFVNFTYRENDTTNTQIGTNWNFFNPKVGIKYISDKTEFWTSLAKTNREVTRSDMFRGYDHLVSFGDLLNPNFLNSDSTLAVESFVLNTRPEIVYNLEVGLKKIYRKLTLSGNLYGMFFQNERVANGEVNYIGLLLRQPVDRSYRTGFEFDGAYTHKSLKLLTNLNYSYNKVYLNNKWTTHAFTPNFIMNNGVEYNYKSFIVGLSGRYVSKTYLDNTQNEVLTTPDYYIMNFNTGFKSDYISVYINVNNFMNTKYFLPGGVSGNQPAYYVGAWRNLFVTFNMTI
jgi:iron complex outermembrane recepter protein